MDHNFVWSQMQVYSAQDFHSWIESVRKGDITQDEYGLMTSRQIRSRHILLIVSIIITNIIVLIINAFPILVVT